MPPATSDKALRKTLRETFGYTRLRAGQEEVIASVLNRKDTLAIMPTGAGKSLCYQLPALHLPGLTVEQPWPARSQHFRVSVSSGSQTPLDGEVQSAPVVQPQ